MRTILRRGRVASTLVAALAAGLAGIAVLAETASAKDKVKASIQNNALTVAGTGASEAIALRLRSGDSTTLQIDVGDDGSADLTFKRDRFDHILVDAGNGNDTVRIDDVNGAFTDTEATTLNGERGDDSLMGGRGPETLSGGDGNDTIRGGQDNDVALMGADDDTFIWNPGDASDTVEGQAGADTLQFNGANASEKFDLSANGNRLQFLRDIANVKMDVDGVETVDANARGSADTVTVHDLSGTAVQHVAVDLSASAGGGDGEADGVVVEGTPNADVVEISRTAASPDASVTGLAADVSVTGADPTGDTLTVDGKAGDDRLIENAADGSIMPVKVEGGDGVDTVEVDGSDDGETFTAIPNAPRVRVDRVTPAPFNLDIGTSENLIVNANGGDDTVTGLNGLATLISLTIDGGPGADTITGGDGDDHLLGGDGNDTVAGGRGDDVAFLGANDDTFIWNPGDASDTVEGQGGSDTMRFNGANIAEKFEISANGGRVRFTRDIASVTMDLDDVERIDLNALGGADRITVNDLSGTDVTAINTNLAASGGGGDGAADEVIVNGTTGADVIVPSGDSSAVTVKGLTATVNVTGFEAANDTLTINALAGQDTLTASGLAADVIKLQLNGGDDADTFIASPGKDLVAGGRGDDVALLGAGDDTFVWNPGDGSDAVEGQAGTDTLQFNGASIAEKIDIAANGGRVRFSRDIANITMDLNGVERITVNALGGADTITVNDLSGTGVTEVNANLAASAGGGDGDPDNVVVNGTAGSDVIQANGDASGVAVLGLAARVNITGAESANDTLTINALAGDDVIDGSGLTADAVKLAEFGGDGDDVLLGGAGDDVIRGEAGDDVLIGGPGLDDLDGGPGNNIIIQD